MLTMLKKQYLWEISHVFRYRTFRLFWLGQFISVIGDSLIPITVSFAIIDLSGSATDIGIVLGSLWGARILFILLGGVWSDRLPRRLVMIGSDLARAINHGVVAFTFFTDIIQVWHLALSSALYGAASAFFAPASSGIIPELVPKEYLRQANAIISISNSIVMLFGPALAGFLVQLIGYGPIFAFDALTFIISALFLLSLRLPESFAYIGKQTFFTDVKYGFREVTKHQWIWVTSLATSLTNVAVASFYILGPIVINQKLGGSVDWGLIMTSSSIGGILGGILSHRFFPSRPFIPAFIIMGLSISMEIFSLIPPIPLWGLMTFAALTSASTVLTSVFWDTLVQQHVSADVLSRVNSLDSLISFVFMPLGFIVSGPLADKIGLNSTLYLMISLALIPSLGVLLVPAVRNLRSIEGKTENM